MLYDHLKEAGFCDGDIDAQTMNEEDAEEEKETEADEEKEPLHPEPPPPKVNCDHCQEFPIID
jgi:hypothetical protein